MLNVSEIRNLEDMWKKYKRKKYMKIFFYIFLLLIVATILLLFYFGLFDKILSDTLNFKQGETKKVLKKEYQNKIISANKKELKKNTPKSYKSKQNDINQSEKKSKNITNNDINHTKNIVKPIAVNVTVQKLKNSAKEENITVNLNNNDMLQLNTKFLNHIYSKEMDKNISKNILAQSTKKQKKQSVKNNNTSKSNLQNIKKERVKKYIEKRPKIIISSKKIDKLKYLKERYNESGKTLYAILLSKEYYRKKMYKKSLIWATTANNIDSSNEDSWIMFAKCKVKLGKKNDAINALRAYLKVNSSKKIRILLANIINGVF